MKNTLITIELTPPPPSWRYVICERPHSSFTELYSHLYSHIHYVLSMKFSSRWQYTSSEKKVIYINSKLTVRMSKMFQYKYLIANPRMMNLIKLYNAAIWELRVENVVFTMSSVK